MRNMSFCESRATTSSTDTSWARDECRCRIGWMSCASKQSRGLSAYDYLAGLNAATGTSLFTSFGLSGTPVVVEISADERAAMNRTGTVYAPMHQGGFVSPCDRQCMPDTKQLLPQPEKHFRAARGPEPAPGDTGILHPKHDGMKQRAPLPLAACARCAEDLCSLAIGKGSSMRTAIVSVPRRNSHASKQQRRWRGCVFRKW